MNSYSLINKLIDLECFKEGDFLLKSGRKSNYYIDLRILVSYPELLKEISILQMIQEETSHWFSKSVYSEFQANKTSNFYKDILLQEGIDTINKMSTASNKNLESDNKVLSQLVLVKNHLSVPMNVLVIGALGKL